MYLSADVDYGGGWISAIGRAGHHCIYAAGRIVIWVRNSSPIDVSKLGMDSLLQPAARKIAIANPLLRLWPGGGCRDAPFQCLTASTTFGFLESIAQALNSCHPCRRHRHRGAPRCARRSDAFSRKILEIPPDAYPRLDQGMAILQARTSGHLKTAQAFYEWFRGLRAIHEVRLSLP
jgi:molybdate transport system substrate-binding protein